MNTAVRLPSPQITAERDLQTFQPAAAPKDESAVYLKRVIFNALNAILSDPAVQRPTWLLGTISQQITSKFDVEPLLRSALRLARNRWTGSDDSHLYIHTYADGSMLTLEIDEQDISTKNGRCLVTVSLGLITY